MDIDTIFYNFKNNIEVLFNHVMYCDKNDTFSSTISSIEKDKKDYIIYDSKYENVHRIEEITENNKTSILIEINDIKNIDIENTLKNIENTLKINCIDFSKVIRVDE